MNKREVEKKRERDRQTETETHRETEKETERERDRERQRDIQEDNFITQSNTGIVGNGLVLQTALDMLHKSAHK